jgi:hypothetical protein
MVYLKVYDYRHFLSIQMRPTQHRRKDTKDRSYPARMRDHVRCEELYRWLDAVVISTLLAQLSPIHVYPRVR